jgi:hypothetical protein
VRRALSLALSLALFAAASTATARDRPLELFLGDMTPSGSRACMRDLGRELRRREQDPPVNVTRMGTASVRRLVGDPDGDFLAWTADQLHPILAQRRETPFDAVAIVDCREADHSAQLLVVSASGRLARFALRDTGIDEERGRWLGRTLLMHALLGFAP